MRVDEAKIKWCPFARGPWFNNTRTLAAAVNRSSSDEAYGHCIANECMAWRWLTLKDGYCGLAGTSHAFREERES